jgi:hypothetical protein
MATAIITKRLPGANPSRGETGTEAPGLLRRRRRRQRCREKEAVRLDSWFSEDKQIPQDLPGLDEQGPERRVT